MGLLGKTTDRIVHAVERESTLWKLVNGFLEAYNRRTDAEAKQNGGDNSQVLNAINNLDRKVDEMSTNIDRIEKEAADLAEDVPVIKQALEDLKTLVSDLKSQVAQGQLDQARLDAAAAALEKVDDDLDAITAPEAPPTEG